MPKFTTRQKEIIRITTDLIGSGGIQNVTTKNLSEQLGISEAAIYRHFESKMKILAAVLAYYHDIFRRQLEEIRSKSGFPVERIRHLFEFQFEYFSAQPEAVAVIFSEGIFMNDPDLKKAVMAIMQTKRSFLVKQIREGRNKGAIREEIPEDQLALIIMGGLRMIVTRWKLTDYTFDLNKEGLRYWDTIENLLYKLNRYKY